MCYILYMPILIEINGIKIFMNYQFNEHNPPHIHGVKGNNRCSVDLDGNILEKGRMSSKDIKIVIDYILNNKNDLKDLWEKQCFKEYKEKRK